MKDLKKEKYLSNNNKQDNVKKNDTRIPLSKMSSADFTELVTKLSQEYTQNIRKNKKDKNIKINLYDDETGVVYKDIYLYRD